MPVDSIKVHTSRKYHGVFGFITGAEFRHTIKFTLNPAYIVLSSPIHVHTRQVTLCMLQWFLYAELQATNKIVSFKSMYIVQQEGCKDSASLNQNNTAAILTQTRHDI